MEEKNTFIGYEYLDIVVQKNYFRLFEDGYENFGWKLENVINTPNSYGTATIKFKRDRKLKNKHEISKLQRQFNETVSEIDHLERKKGFLASTAAYVIGVIGTCFVAAAVFSITYWSNTPAMIILALIGFIGWIVPYIAFSKIKKNKTKELMPLIDDKYEELYSITKQANELLHQSV